MEKPHLVFIVGCNAAGKSTFIRTRLNELGDFQIFMTDVYKGRTKELVNEAIKQGENILVETVFNDPTFKDLADNARNAGYTTELLVLFLDSIQQSVNRVAAREMLQSGIAISGGNVRLNFNESFKNIATYFFYFDHSHFIYTGTSGMNSPVMSFSKTELSYYRSNQLSFPQKFAAFSFSQRRSLNLVLTFPPSIFFC